MSNIPLTNIPLNEGVDGLTMVAAAASMNFINDGDSVLVIESRHTASVSLTLSSNTNSLNLSKTITRTIPIGSINPQIALVGPFQKTGWDKNGRVELTISPVANVRIGVASLNRPQ